MNCVTYEGKVVQISLLTQSDKIQKIETIFSKNRHKLEIFLPDDSFYGSVVAANDPERMADILFKWLDIKHRSVHIHVDPNQHTLLSYTHKKNASQISLSLQALQDPLLCGALVAHGIIHHLLLARAKISLGDSDEDEALTDIGTIYAGFGVLLLNNFESDHHSLGSLGRRNYASEFFDYCSQQRIVESLWLPYVIPSIASEYFSNKATIKKLRPFIRLIMKKRQIKKRNTITYAVLFVLITIGAVFYSSTRTEHLSPAMQEQHDSIAILKIQYEKCADTVAYKQQKWDNSDIFIQRQIEADKTRCTSLKNRYNFEVNEYNSKL